MNPVVLVPAEDGAATSVIVLDERCERAVRRVRLALDLARPQARSPPPDLKVELAGELLCLEYREPD